MKYLNIVLIAFFLTSCCGTKKVVENTPKPIAQVETSQSKGTINSTASQDHVKTQKEEQQSQDKVTEVEEPIVEHDTTFESFSHHAFTDLLRKHVSEEGKVDYKGFKIDASLLRNYIKSLGTQMPNDDWSKEDKLAYWINAYNAMTIDLIIRNYPVNSIKDIDKPWEQRLWKLGEKWYNLDEIEHQILRKMNEPRIHFAIVCASFSCPKLQNEAFQASNFEEQLTEATKEFLSDTKRNSISENNLKLSKIFKWFAKDFKQDGSLIEFLNQYTDVEISSKAKKSFLDYNWDLNN